jgi:deoxycytidine triphosphate deaminase
MSVLSNQQIKQAVKNGSIICHPYNEDNVSYSTIDITLGHYYFRAERNSEYPLYNPLDREDVEAFFDGPFKAITHQQWCDLYRVRPIRGIPLDHPVISMKPGERILSHSHEFVGTKGNLAFDMRCHSSWSRSGIIVSFNLGWLEPGFVNRLTIEVMNLNKKEVVLLPVGERIVRLVFHETGEVKGKYGDKQGGVTPDKILPSHNLATIISEWSPDQMLPKAYLDQRVLPKKIAGMSYD